MPHSSSPSRQENNQLAIKLGNNSEQMATLAAQDIANALQKILTQKPLARVVFASAPSQATMLRALVQQADVDWSRVTAFHMDEYIGLLPDAAQRFANWLDNHLFMKLPFHKVERIVPESDAQACAAVYAELLNAAPIDMVCLGIGVNGHIAFNDPPVADFEDPLDVKVVELDDACRQQQVDDGCFLSLEAVPKTAVTLTVPRLLRADSMFCVVPGAHKRKAVMATIHSLISTACPATILRTHPNCNFYFDPDSYG